MSLHLKCVLTDLQITSDVVSTMIIHWIFRCSFFFAPNKDDDSFATILMFLSSTFLLKMLGYELMNEIIRLMSLWGWQLQAVCFFDIICPPPPTRGYLRMVWCFLLLFIVFFLKWLELYRDVCFPPPIRVRWNSCFSIFHRWIFGFHGTWPKWGLRQGVPCQGVLMPLSFASQAGGSLTKNLG